MFNKAKLKEAIIKRNMKDVNIANIMSISKQALSLKMRGKTRWTIDDVNMVGLVDILRYEFEDSQIFISTHEQKFEWYLRYKYEKTGKAFRPYNMRKLLLEENS